MARSIVFVDEAKKATIRQWYDTFRKKLPVAVEDRRVETSFGATHALVAGPPDAPPLVVIHGALASSAHVLPELGTLTTTRRVYALDVIGQSVMSADRRIDLDDDDYGRWAVEAAMALGLDRYDLLGVSWGGFVALRAARVAPQRLKHLVLVVPAGIGSNSVWAGLRDAGWPMLMYRTFPSRTRLLRALDPLFSTFDEDWTAYFGDALLCYRFDMRVPPLAKDGDLSAVACPALIFGAEHDVHFPGPALIKRAKALLPQAEVEILHGSKHSPPFTAAFRTTLSARIDSFLNETNL